MAVLDRRRPTTEALLASILDEVAEADVGTDALTRALGQIASSNHWDLGALWVVDDAADLLRPIATWARDPEVDDADRRRTMPVSLARGEGLPGRAWADRATLTDAEASGAGSADCDGRFVTTLHRPIEAGGRVVGIIELLAETDEDPRPWMESALRAAEPAMAHLLERVRDRLAVRAAEGRLAAARRRGAVRGGRLRSRVGPRRVVVSDGRAARPDRRPRRRSPPALLAAVHPDDLEEIQRSLQGLSDSGSGDERPVHHVEYRVQDQGELRWLSTRITATVLPSGQTQIAVITSDVTERKQVEQRTQRRAMAIEGLQWVSQAIIAGRELRDTATAVSHAATGVLGAVYGVVLYQVPGDTTDELAWALSGVPTDLEIPDPPSDLELPRGPGRGARSGAGRPAEPARRAGLRARPAPARRGRHDALGAHRPDPG